MMVMSSIAKVTKRSSTVGEAARLLASPGAWFGGAKKTLGSIFHLDGDKAIRTMESLDALTNNELRDCPLVANFKNAFLTGSKNLFLPFSKRSDGGIGDALGNLNRTLQEQQIGRTSAVAPLHYDSGIRR